jgi:Transglutaminase-like superfamily
MMKTLIVASLMTVVPFGGMFASQPEYVVIEKDNPVCYANTVFSEPEDLSRGQFDVLLNTYGLKKMVESEHDEFARILLLRNWLNRQLVRDRSRPAVSGDVLGMLKQGPRGGSFSCGHYEAAQSAVLNAMGYVTRCVLSGPDGTEARLTGSHGSNEVWCNSLCKWVMVDAEHDCHFEKDGLPLSALELREAYLADGGQGVLRVRGPAREPQDWGRHDQWGNTPKSYGFISWRLQANRFSLWPARVSSVEIVYDDEFFKRNIWHKSGKKHWAYDSGDFLRVEDRNQIYWTPNVLELDVEISGAVAQVAIKSCTPNLREYQIKREGEGWEPVENRIILELSRASEEFVFRSVNTAGVTGPVYKLLMERK